MSTPDTMVLEESIRVLSRALDALVGQCTDEDGKPKAPERADLMRARALLPFWCPNALAREKKG